MNIPAGPSIPLSEQPKKRYLNRLGWLVIALTGVLMVFWQMPQLRVLQGVDIMPLWLHTALETFSVVVAMMIFAVGWNTYSEERSANILLISCALLAVGLIDLAHMLSFRGMPDFITPAGREKGINFWLAARFIAAIALLVVAFRSWPPFSNPRFRYVLLFASLALTVLVYWLVLFFPGFWPRTFIEGRGLTPFKIAAEYTFIAIMLPAAAWFHGAARRGSRNASSLFAAVAVIILSELCFTLYSDVTDALNLLGHIYKVIAFSFLYRAIFVSAVREPYHRALIEIAERKLVEKALKESSEYNRTLFENASIGLALCRMDGTLVDINQAYADILGRSIEETKGLTYWQITPEEYAGQEQQQLENLRLTGCYGPYEKDYLHRNGNRVPVRLQGRLIEKNGESLIWSSVEDISTRRHSENSLREREAMLNAFLVSSPLGMMMLDKKLRHTSVNPALAAMSGVPVEQHLGRTAEEVVPKTAPMVAPLFHKVLESGEALHNIEFSGEVPRYPGILRWWLMTLFPILGTDGRPFALGGVILDITERRQTEQALVEAEQRLKALNEELEQRVEQRTRQLEAANKELEAFSYSVSHDLRAPLRSVDGFSQILLRDHAEKLDETGRDYLQRVARAGKRMGELIDDLLQLSRVGRSELKRETIDLSKLVCSVGREIKSADAQRQVEWVIQPGVTVEADGRLMRTMLENLLRNAWKFSAKKAGARIEFGTVEQEGEKVLFVRDNGAGFDMQYAHKLFGAFQRLHRGEEFEGTGIGLAIVQRIINHHGGRIWAESAPEQGATFYFTI